MKVALELQPCCGKRTGIGTYTYELAKRLEDCDGLEFCGNLFNFRGRNDNSATLSGITIPIRENRLMPYGVYRRIWNLIPIPYHAMFQDRADLSIFFNYIVPPHISGKVMTTIYDLTYLRFPETMDRRNLRRLEKGMRYSVERSDHILTISDFSKSEIEKLLGVPEYLVSVVPCAPTLLEKAPNPTGFMERFGVKKPYLLYVGTIEPRKNLIRLIEAFSRLKKEQGVPHQLVLAGGKGWGNTEIYRIASLTMDVVCTGYISDDEKYDLYQNADAFIFPSLYEGFGIPPLEAMAYGCPVVCANVASLPEVVGDAAELVEPTDDVNIAQGIWNVISHPSRRDELIRLGFERVKRYTWATSAKKLTDICKTVLEA